MLITFGSFAEGYSLFVQLPAFANREIILGKYIDTKVYPVDTIQLNRNGEGRFHNTEKLDLGLYMLVFNSQPVIEFLVGKEQNLEFHQTENGIELTGSKSAAQFLNYQALIRSANAEKNRLIKEVGKASKEDKAAIASKIDEIELRLVEFIENDLEQFKGTMYADFLNASKPFEYPLEISSNINDPQTQRARYLYQRDHFMDAINFSNPGLINTPVLKSKLQFYLNKVLIQHPDSIIPQAMKLLEQEKLDASMFKYLSGFLLNYAQESKIMGMDRLTVEVADFSYLSGKANWVDDEFMKELRIQIRMLRNNLIGQKAPEIILYNSENEMSSLYDVDADFTVLVFWEVDCGHCKIEIPKLKSTLDSISFPKTVQVFAVHTDNKYNQWLQAIDDNDLYNWTNVYNKDEATLFKIDYNVVQTPLIYVLDKEKKIIAKKLSVDQIVDFILHSSLP